jgi:hypothetical protein
MSLELLRDLEISCFLRTHDGSFNSGGHHFQHDGFGEIAAIKRPRMSFLKSDATRNTHARKFYVKHQKALTR